MRTPKILANVSNVLVTLFLIVLIPCTIIGTYFIVKNSSDIQKNTRFREKIESMGKENDSLYVELKLERRLRHLYRENTKKAINDTSI